MPIEQVEYDGLRLSFEAVTSVLPSVPLALRLKLEPAPEGARVEVEFQKNDEPVQQREARTAGEEGEVRFFSVELPPFEAGDRVKVTLTGRCRDQRVPAEGDEEAASFEFRVIAPEVFPDATVTAAAFPLLMPLDRLLPPQETSRSRRLLEALSGHGISRAVDLLALDHKVLAGLKARDRKRAKQLAAHAALSPAVEDAVERDKVFNAGFSSLPEIAAIPLAEFRKRTGGVLDQRRADEVHRTVTKQVAFLNHLMIGNGVAKMASDIGGAGGTAKCSCRDCESATSPLAFLADLISYIRSTVHISGSGPGGLPTDSAMDTGALASLVQQPLDELILSCGPSTDPVRKVRLIIETLRRYLRANVPADADVVCSPFALSIEFVIAGDVDGDRRDELVVAFRRSASAWLDFPAGVEGGFFVMDFDPQTRQWSHLAPMPDGAGADFLLEPNLIAKSGFCADIDGDGRAEVVIAVGNYDGSADPQLGKTWLWVMDFDPAQAKWQHLNPATFAQARADLWLDNPALQLLQVFPADVDGDGAAEIAIAAASPAAPNAFWVYDLVTSSGQPAWLPLSPGADAALPAFEPDPPSPQYQSYPPRLASAGDADLNGRDEIIAFPDGPGRIGGSAWVMAYDPPNPPAPGTVGTWRHVSANLGIANADLEDTWPQAARAAHAFIGSTRGQNGWSLLLAPEATPAPNLTDPNRFYEVRYGPTGLPGPWTAPVQIDCTTQNRAVSRAIAVDVDGDLTDELVVVIQTSGRRAAWIMDRQPNGSWQHLSPVQNHPMEADLEWTALDYPFQGVVAADIDLVLGGSLHQELVFYGSTCNQIWVMHYDEVAKVWKHASPVLPPDLDDEYLLTTYQALLAELGTSLEDLRNARAAEAGDREALAERLGLPLQRGANLPDTLDRLLIAPSDLTEAGIEELFGLVDTTRNPLSSVQVLGPERAQIRRLELEGIEWSANPWIANVGRESELSLNLARMPGGKVRVDLLRAGGGLMAWGEGEADGRVRLNEQMGSGVSGWAELAYKRDAVGILVQTMPLLMAWRLGHLRNLWDEQDWPLSPFQPGGQPTDEPVWPVIDPDVIGPDDFRVPLEKVNAGDPDGTFDLWVERRAWVDARLKQLQGQQPKLTAMLDSLRPPQAGPGATPEDYPWNNAPPETEFPKLAEALTRRGTGADAARATVRSKLWLPTEAFLRLVSLREKRQAQQLSGAEWEEVRSILVLALKRRRYALWRNEEQAAAVTLNTQSFWTITRLSLEGQWPPVIPAGQALVDPEIVAPSDLPQGRVGALAHGLWRARRARLDELTALIRAQKPNGLENMVVTAVGNPPQGTTWQARIAVLAAELESSDPNVSQPAENAILALLGLTPGPFRRLAQVSARLAGGSQLSETEWLDVESLLTCARKQKQEIAIWLQEEQAIGQAIGGQLPYWRARRAMLPRWRASQDQRQAWEAELRRQSQTPTVDPDLFPATWLRKRSFGEPASTLYAARKNWLKAEAQALAGLRRPTASLMEQADDILRSAFFPAEEAARLRNDFSKWRQAQNAAAVLQALFGKTAADLTALQNDLASANATTKRQAQIRAAEEFWLDPVKFARLEAIAAKAPANVTQAEWNDFDKILTEAALVGRIVGAQEESRRSGVRMRSLLEQLNLTATAHALLLRVRQLAATGGPILDTEWETVMAIALRARKARRYGEWRREEESSAAPDRRVRLSPDHFAIPSEDGDWQPPTWLVMPEESRRWRDTLEARRAQHAAVIGGLGSAVGRVEEHTLPILRDALLKAVAPPQGPAAKWVRDHFFVDPKGGGCQQTTRAAHAIDTLLTLLWSLRTASLQTTYPMLWLDAPFFDQDWRWIGSYATWRSAVLARLYPENLLRPSMRRKKSPVFAEILRELRSGRTLTPTHARELAKQYADYFRDVCSLDLGKLACTRVNGWTRLDEDIARRSYEYDFLFATSERSGKVYWSTLQILGPPAVPTGYEHSFWQQLSALPDNVSGLVGAATYTPRPPTPHAAPTGWVYLFAVTRELRREAGEEKVRNSLICVRYNLVTRQWDAPQELQPPPGSHPFSVRLLAGSPTDPPKLGFVVSAMQNGVPLIELYSARMDAKGTGWDDMIRLPWTWSSTNLQLPAVPRELLAIDPDGDGLFDLAAVPGGTGPIAFYRFAAGSPVADGTTSRPVESESKVCVGDFDADGKMEIAWTLNPSPADVGRSTVVLVEKRTAAGQWVAHRQDPTRADGGSAAGTDNTNLLSPFLVAGDLDRVARDEIILAIQDHTELWRLPSGSSEVTGTWGSFWSISSFGQQYRRNSPFTYSQDPDLRSRYAREGLGAAFSVSPGEFAMSLGVMGDFDGDGFDELAAFLAPIKDDLSRGNDFWAVDCRAALPHWLRPLGVPSGNQLGTTGDLSADPIIVAAAIAADVDGDGRDELIAIPYTDQTSRGVLIGDFIPGGGADPADGGYWASLPKIDLSPDTTPVTFGVGADLDGDGCDELVLFGIGKTWIWKFDPAQAKWIRLADPPTNMIPTGKTVAAAVAGKFVAGKAEQVAIAFGTAAADPPTEDLLAFNWIGNCAIRYRYVRAANDRNVTLLALSAPGFGATRTQCTHAALKPVYQGAEKDWILDDTANIDDRRARTQLAFEENSGMPLSIAAYLWEAFYELPVAIALQLQRARQFTSALDWFRLIYDRSRPLALRSGDDPFPQCDDRERKTFYGLVLDEKTGAGGLSNQTLLDWLRDPLDIYAVAMTRPHTFTRAALLMIVRCLLDYADAEFTIDTSEAIARAERLYDAALELLRLPVLDGAHAACSAMAAQASAMVARATSRLEDAEVRAIAERLGAGLSLEADPGRLAASLEALVSEVRPLNTPVKRIEKASEVAARELDRVPLAATLASRLEAPVALDRYGELMRTPTVAAAVNRLGQLSLAALPASPARAPLTVWRPATTVVPLPSPAGATPVLWGAPSGAGIGFCHGPNPLLQAYRLHAELNRHKIRTCRNIAGLRRKLEFYAAPTDQRSGLPMIGASGELAPLAQQLRQPTPYRYSVLVERAKDLARTAQQLEALMLNAIERRDAEALALLDARQSAGVARETVRLNELQVRQAEDRVVGAGLQQERAQIEQDHYTELIAAGQLEYEIEALSLLEDAVVYQNAAAWIGWGVTAGYGAAAVAYGVAASSGGAEEIAQTISTATQALASAGSVQSIYAQIKSTQSQIASMRASFERVRQEWQLRQRLATQDIRIAAQERLIEEDGVRIAEQQRNISELQADNAERIVDFLATKFTNVELYEWLAQGFEQAYVGVLQHATSTARLAASQFQFEHPDGVPPTIQLDYWQPPADYGANNGSTSDGAVNRRGLTGAERLLQDLIELDQYAFLNNKRKLQLSKTFSLALLMPLELHRLRTTGVTTFSTPAELFNRDFPGHYLRLIKRVSVSLVALVPPAEGIHATLTSGGISRVVTGQDIFQTVILRNDPQPLALTSPINATGVFTFEPQPEFTNPFENDGVDSTWEFSLPRAGNRFGFQTIADLIVTIDYTALHSDDYRHQVMRQLDQRFSAEKVLSLRYDLPDAWWDLHNPDQIPTPMAVEFRTVAQEFPPNVHDLEIEHLACVIASAGAVPREVSVRLKFTEVSGDPRPPTSWLEAVPIDGQISTRRGNASTWLGLLGRSPIGKWGFSMPDTGEVRDWIQDDGLSDLLLVISYKGRTPAWPT